MPTTSYFFDADAMARAISKAGGKQRDLAEAIGCTRAHVSWMLLTGRMAPHRAIAIEKATGVSRKSLLPSIYR